MSQFTVYSSSFFIKNSITIVTMTNVKARPRSMPAPRVPCIILNIVYKTINIINISPHDFINIQPLHQYG